jgi:hypothetical protein
MSTDLYQFITRSPLFAPRNVEEHYRRLSDQDIERELATYREVARSELTAQSSREQHGLTVMVEGVEKSRPDTEFLKQCALYLDNIVIDDPIYPFTAARQEIAETLNTYLGMPPREGLNRQQLAQAATYINRLRAAIKAEFVTPVPISDLHEPPEQIPMYYSENLFADELPKDIFALFHERVRVSPMKKADDGGWITIEGEPLTPCRAIWVEFEDAPSLEGMVFYLVEQQVTSLNE